MIFWTLLPIAGLAAVFLASLTAREPIRLPRRLGATPEAAEIRSIHRPLVAHIALTLSTATVIAAAMAFRSAWPLLILAIAPAVHLAGERIAYLSPRLVRLFLPLLAPLDGAALLIDWLVSPMIRRDRENEPERGSEEEALAQVVELTHTTVERVVIPRSGMAWLPAEASLEEILETAQMRPHSRYPVIEGDFAGVVGMLDLVDLFAESIQGDSTARRLARPPSLVPETIGCDDLVEWMRRDRFDVAAVLDEFGSVAGIVTLEDLLELLVGDLSGEHESIPVRIRRRVDGTFLVDGALRLDEFEEIFGISLPAGDYETMAGLVLERNARIPHVGEVVDLGDLNLEVAAVDSRRIRSLLVSFRTPPNLKGRISFAS